MNGGPGGSNSSPLPFLHPGGPGRGAKRDPELDGWLWGKEGDPRRLTCAESWRCFSRSSPPVRCDFFTFKFKSESFIIVVFLKVDLKLVTLVNVTF